MAAVAFIKKYILGGNILSDNVVPLADGQGGKTPTQERFVMAADCYTQKWCEDMLTFPQMDEKLPGGFPMLLSGGEATLLYWLVANRYTGQGEIVDLGAFLGGSALCCARGL